MSKSKKDVGGDPFAALSNTAHRSAADDAAEMHGAAFGSVQSIRVSKIDIDQVQPDVLQPRRVVPAEIRGDWKPSSNDMHAFFKHWIDASGIDPIPYFEEETTFEAPDYTHPVQIALQRIIRLAADIHRNGLSNPITVVREGRNRYFIETGERRWFAYHLLRVIHGDEYAEIPARTMNERSVWRQASENNQRDDLNAVSKARQYAILMMDLLSRQGEPFLTADEFDNERAYYAQVAEARIPHGYGEQIQSAMGFTSRKSVQRHRDLLSLSDLIWNIADDYDVPESVLRKLNGLPQDEQLQVLNYWAVQNGKEAIVTNGHNPGMNEDAGNQVSAFDKLITQFSKIPRRVKKLNEKERATVIKMLEALLDDLRK